MKTVGLVLSGGAARGIAHLGVLAALDELGVKVSGISGVSAGAIVGALYAAGNAPDALLKEVHHLYDFQLLDLSWLRNRVFALSGLRKIMERLIGEKDFGQLKIPLFVTATDVARAMPVTFSEGNVLEIVMASSSIPAFNSPVQYKGHQLFDGGILNNMPVEPIKGKYDVIIGSYVNKITNGIKTLPNNKMMLLDQCFHLAIHELIKPRAAACDIFIEPSLHEFGLFDLKKADRLFELGYRETMGKRGEITDVLS
jgi:NTE family protein